MLKASGVLVLVRARSASRWLMRKRPWAILPASSVGIAAVGIMDVEAWPLIARPWRAPHRSGREEEYGDAGSGITEPVVVGGRAARRGGDHFRAHRYRLAGFDALLADPRLRRLRHRRWRHRGLCRLR